MDWNDARRLHCDAAESLAVAAEAVPRDRWLEPRAERKWSPAEVVEHLSMAYDVLMGELAGGPAMKYRANVWQRALLRWTILPRLLKHGWFPKGVRSPREIRPSLTTSDQAEAIARFRDRAAKFTEACDRARVANPRARLTHPYFGTGRLNDALVLCARHVQHHQKQLPA